MAEQFSQGSPELVRKLNLMVREINSLMRMQGDPFIRVSSNAAGTTLRLDMGEVIKRIPRYGGSMGGGGSSTGNPALSGWFELIDTSSSPMLGQKQTCNNGAFSDEEEFSAAEGTPIYPNPGSSIAEYNDDDIIFANFVGNCWVAVSLFGNTEAAEPLFDECP